MLYKITSAALHGIEAYPVEVEVDICPGFPTFVTVGLPDAAVRESKERVRAALKNCGYDLESKRITINLAPADRRKEGSAFDLPISLGLLAHLGVFPIERLSRYLFLGELALDGRLKPARGVLPVALLARTEEFEAVAINGVGVFETLREISKQTVPIVRDKLFGLKPSPSPDTAPVPAPPSADAPGPGPEPARVPTGRTTRLAVKSGKEIEDELDKLSKEYTGK